MGYTIGYILAPVRGRMHVYQVHRALGSGKIIYQAYHAWYASEAAAFDAICLLNGG